MTASFFLDGAGITLVKFVVVRKLQALKIGKYLKQNLLEEMYGRF